MPCSHGPSCREAELVASTGWRRRRTALSRLYLDKVYRGSICLRLVLPSSFYTPLGDEGRPKFAQCLVPRPPHDAHRRRVGRRAPTPTITTDRRLARPCGEQKFGSLRACRMLCDVWTLARNARKLAFHPCLGPRANDTVVGSLCDRLRSAPRPDRLRRASMARRSTAACSVCSRHSVQPRQALCDGLNVR